MDRSFLPSKMVGRINALSRRAEETARALGPTTTIQLYRMVDGLETALPPVEVRIEYPNSQANARAGTAGGRESIDGVFVARAPWNVEAGDVAFLPSGQSVRIEFVELEHNGIARARFSQVSG